MDSIEQELDNGKKAAKEGHSAVISLDNLTSGKRLTAWSTGEILSHYLNVDIPNPENVRSIPMNNPQMPLREYRYLFEFKS